MGTQVALKGQEKRDKNLNVAFFQTQVPHSGNWLNRNSTCDAVPRTKPSTRIEDMAPAGLRLPKTYKLNYPDNIPRIKNKMSTKGASHDEIEKQIIDKKLAAQDRYGNKSTVGYLISPPGKSEESPLYTRMRLDRDKLMRAVMQKEVSDYNRAIINKKVNKSQKVSRLLSINQGTHDDRNDSVTRSNISQTIYSTSSNPPTYNEKEHRFSTVNKELHGVQKMPDLSPFKKNFKRKSIFQQWTDATYNHGVYFNPAVNCL